MISSKTLSRDLRLRLGVGILIVVLVVGGAVYGYIKWKQRLPAAFARTPGNVAFEELIPGSAFAVVTFNPSESSQTVGIQGVMDAFLKAGVAADVPNIRKLIIEKFIGPTQKNVTVEEAAALFDEHVRVGFAMNETMPIILVSVRDAQAARTLLKRLEDGREGAEIVKDTAEVFYMTDPHSEGNEVGLVGDVIFILKGGKERALALIKNYEQGGTSESLARTPDFLRVAQKLEVPLAGYGYINFNGYEEYALKKLGVEKEAAPLKNQLGPVSQIFSYRSTPDGIAFDTFARLENGERTEEEEEVMAYLSRRSSLALLPKIPVRSPLLFAGSNVIPLLIEPLFADVNSAGQIESMLGLPVADLRAFVRKESVFAIENLGDPIPALSFYLDSQDVETSKKIISKLDSLLDGVLYAFNLSMRDGETPADAPVVERVAFTTEGLTGSTIRFYLDRIPKDVAAIPFFAIFTEPFEVSYGVMSDGLFLISTARAADQRFKETARIDSVPLFAELRTKLNTPLDSFAYVDTGSILKLIIGVIESRKEDKNFSPLTVQALKSLESIKGILTTSSVSSKTVEGTGILRIAQ